jgi:hypothetical protein
MLSAAKASGGQATRYEGERPKIGLLATRLSDLRARSDGDDASRPDLERLARELEALPSHNP